MRYEDHILKMQEFTGFYDKWTSLLGYYKTNEEAYYAAERIYHEHFGKDKYKNFESFKTQVSKYFNKPKPIPRPVRRAKRKTKKNV